MNDLIFVRNMELNFNLPLILSTTSMMYKEWCAL